MSILQVLHNTLSRITGDKPLDYYLAGLFFCSLALLLSWYLHSLKRDPASPNTPERFSWIFLLWDNCKKGGVTLILVFFFFRIFDLSNVFAMIGVGFFLSMGLDKAIQWIQDKTDLLKFLDRNRENFPQKPTV